MVDYTIIYIPKETVSDDVCKITDLPYTNGHFIDAGAILGTVETSKVDIDIEANVSGYVFYSNKVVLGKDISVHEIFCVISPVNTCPTILASEATKIPPIEEDNLTTIPRISKSARNLIEQHGLDINLFKYKKIVNIQEVELFLQGRSDSKENTNRFVPNEIKSIPTQATNFYAANSIVIIGAGGHAKMVIDIIQQQRQFTIVGLTSNDSNGSPVFGLPILGKDEDVLENLYQKGVRFAAIGVGALKNPAFRIKIAEKLQKIGYQLPALIHHKAIVEPSAKLEAGVQVMAGAIIGSDVQIDQLCIINSGAIISHDCKIGQNVHITPGAMLAGSVTIGNNSIVGMGCTIYIGTHVGANTIIVNGVNVFKNIQDNEIIKQ
jgi:sugar O-acyltransferase (sialic acid O-acetyltransferase NeuD family)